MLRVAGLGVGYGSRPVLSGIDLEVDGGEVVAVVGPSGAGKSTLLLCLSGLLLPQEGTVHLDDVCVSAGAERQRDRIRRERFGFVFQFGDLVPELTLLENVCLPLRLQGFKAKEAEPIARAQLDALSIGDLADEPVTGVSGGELQRAAICRALVHGPSVVLADEPTGALDEVNAQLVFGQLVGHARRKGAAVVVVTHESWLAEQADRTLRIDHGHLRAG